LLDCAFDFSFEKERSYEQKQKENTEHNAGPFEGFIHGVEIRRFSLEVWH
jgi:hypothetical protein